MGDSTGLNLVQFGVELGWLRIGLDRIGIELGLNWIDLGVKMWIIFGVDSG